MLRLVNPFGVLQDLLALAFYRYGYFVSRHARLFIALPMLLTLALGFGALRVTLQDDLRFLYSPTHSKSRLEYAIHRQFSGDSTNSTFLSLTIESANASDTNLLVRERSRQIYDFNSFVLHNVTVLLGDDSVRFGSEICASNKLCDLSNTIFSLFVDTFWNERMRKDPRVTLDYPVMKIFENKLFLPTHLYGVQRGGPLGLEAIDMVHLIYNVPSYQEYSSDEVCASLVDALRLVNPQMLPNYTTSMFSLPILKDEMQKNATYTVPFLSLTLLLLLAFTIGSAMTGDWITSKPVEALMGIMASTFAIVSSFGLLFAFGVPFIHQVAVMPFIALAIGVDDTYVMLGAWQDTKRTLAPDRRLAQTLEEAGTAISVTSLTSMLSFGIGTFSNTPAIAIFCQFITVAVAFDWLYQVTFFSAVLSLSGQRESAGYHCIMVWKRMPKSEIIKAKDPNAVSPMHAFFQYKFAPFICHRVTRVVMLIIYAVYISLSFYGCSLLRPNLTPSRLVVDDSPLMHYLDLAQSKIWAEGLTGKVYVNRAPDFSTHPEQIDRMLALVGELESTPYSMGTNSTQMWLREFQNYRQFFAEDEGRFYKTLKSFLHISFNSHWEAFLQWEPRPGGSGPDDVYVSKFYFTTAFQIDGWQVRTRLLTLWRNITSRYPEFESLVYDENNFYSDQMLELQTTTLQSLGTAILTLITVCILFVAESSIVFWVVFTLISMDIGTAGFLSLWGADLDPTTVVNILMSIGQCIDFATHIGYRIYRSEHRDPDRRIADALGAMGWPVMQAGLSTLLAILVMILVPSNAVRMFARTSILVVATGFFHGLLILPIIIRSFASDAKAHEPSKHS